MTQPKSLLCALCALCVLCALCAGISNAKVDLSARTTGATGDGQTLDTTRIQKAIDDCAKQGGGTVTLPAGTYLTGTLLLKDNVTLHLDKGATLLGTPDLTQYKNVDPFKDGLGAEVGYAMLAAVDAKNVGVEGEGTIHGNGKAVAAAKSFKGEGWGFRPFLVRFVRCDGVRLSGVTLRDSASWTTNFFHCKNVSADRVTIDSHVTVWASSISSLMRSMGRPHSASCSGDGALAPTLLFRAEISRTELRVRQSPRYVRTWQ